MKPSEVLRRAKDYRILSFSRSALLSIAAVSQEDPIAGKAALCFWRQAGRDFDRAIALAEEEEAA